MQKPDYKFTVLSETATAENTVRFMHQIVRTYGEQIQPLLAKILVLDNNGKTNRDETIKKLWIFCRQNIKYKPDPPQYEALHTPARIWAQKFGDCDDQSIFLASFLHVLKIPFKIRIVAYKSTANYSF